MLEHMRLAKMSFDMWGALSPQGSKPAPGNEDKSAENQSENQNSGDGSVEQPNEKRTMSQAELESTLYKVSFVSYNMLFVNPTGLKYK